MNRYTTGTVAAAVCGVFLAVTACSDSLGPGVGEASVILQGDAVAANVLDGGIALNVAGVPESAVSNLFLTITRVDLHLVGSGDSGEGEGEGEGGEGESSGEGGSWISLDLSLTEPVDILALSTTGLELAAGTVPAGRYNQARFFFDTSEIVLDEQVISGGTTIDPGTYDVNVPSGAQTGLKLQLSSTDVGDGDTETVGVQIGSGATIGTLVWNANGFSVSPRLSQN